jgi:hypothetical protein
VGTVDADAYHRSQTGEMQRRGGAGRFAGAFAADERRVCLLLMRQIGNIVHFGYKPGAGTFVGLLRAGCYYRGGDCR